ncbi:hypothetical protein MA16_Dca000340 [Dendrobium catenatum]|uniref:Uncharacterized protein n=1 Tax=Dendrobium catenatum TaxID=906689 RepID=A0A2I0WTL4_9ASPA|nr:hypothetical protein MA16_Dca000340 [Dendrobium catenatum]
MKFHNLKISVNGERILDPSGGTQKDVPLLEATLGLGADSPISKMEVAIAPVSSAQEDKNHKSITTEELPSQSEIGSSSSTPFIDKNRKKMDTFEESERKIFSPERPLSQKP